MKYIVISLIVIFIIGLISLLMFEEKMSFVDTWILYALFYLVLKQMEKK